MQTYKDVVATFKEKNPKQEGTWKYDLDLGFHRQDPRSGYRDGQLVDHGPGRQGYKDGTSKKQLSFDFKAKKKPTTVGEATIDFIVEKGRQPKPSEVLQIKEKLKKSVTNLSPKKLDSKKVKSVLKNLDIPYQPKLFSGAAVFDDLLKTIPATKVGKFIKGIGLEFEPLFEGGFYEYFRRKGYTHDQAREETFFYKLANPDRTGIMEGADPLLEKELIGTNKTVQKYVNNQKALEEAQNKYRSLVSAHDKARTSGRGRKADPEAAEQHKTQAGKVLKEIRELEAQLNLGQDTYRAAVEKQQTKQGVAGIKYGEYGQGDTERLAARRDKERVRLMNKKFPSYKGPQIDQRLEEYGYYINPDNRYRPKGRSLNNPQGLKLIKGVGYDAISDYFKDQDKTAYFAENFREEKAGGGRVPLSKAGSVDKARRAFLKWLAGITGATIAGGTGLIKLGKGASKVVPKVTEEVIKRGADGTPVYIADLIKVVKAKGIKKIVDSDINKMPDTVHSYKGVEVIDQMGLPHEMGGVTKIKKSTEGVATDSSTGKMHEGISKEVEMEIRPSDRDVYTDPESGMSWYIDEGKGRRVYETKPPDEYMEGTVRPDNEGKMKDFEEGIDDVDHRELKKIADEGTYNTSLPDIDDID